MYKKKTLKRLYSWFMKTLNMRPYHRNWIQGTCPFCGGKDKLGVKPLTNNAKCFKCGYNERVIKLAMDILHVSTEKEAWDSIWSADIPEVSIKHILGEEKINNVESELQLPEHYNNIATGYGLVARMARKYLKNRGFNISELSMKGYGYFDDGPYYGYIFIPYIDNEQLVYWNARRFMGPVGTKYKNPVAEDIGLGKSYVIYNKEALYMYKRVYLCEGAFNAETVGDKGIATAGKFVTDYQVNLITQSPVEEVVLLLDPDAESQSVDLAIKLSMYKKVKVVIFSDPEKDVNDYGKKYTLKEANAHRFLNYGELIQYRNAIKLGKKYDTRKRPEYSHK